MIEFDVLPEREGAGDLVLAHDYRTAAKGDPPTLEEGLTTSPARPTPGSTSTST